MEQREFGRYGVIERRLLVVDEEYQRQIRPPRVRELISTWDNAEFMPLLVNQRVGETVYHVVDGHHRLRAVDGLPSGVGDEIKQYVPCIIHEGWTAEEEADYFWKQQRHRKNLNLLEEFRAQLKAGVPEAIHIEETVRAAGYEMATPNNEGGGRIRAVAALRDIYRRNGVDGLHAVLSLTQAWPDVEADPLARTYHVLLGLATFEKQYRGQYDEVRLRNALAQVGAMTLVRRARERSTANRLNTSRVMVPVIREIYNKSLGRGNHRARLED